MLRNGRGMQTEHMILFVVVVALVVWLVTRGEDKHYQEGFGGFGATSALNFYNRESVCDERGCYIPHHIIL